MTKVTLIYNLIDDALKIYVLDVDAEDLAKLKECHGQFGNSSEVPDDHPVNTWLCEWLEKHQDRLVFKDMGDDATTNFVNLTPSLLIVSGFLP